MSRGFLVAAPSSGSGKTTIALGLMRALRNRGVGVGPAKAGPDFIDPAFHTHASGIECVNLDPWAMRPRQLETLAQKQAQSGSLVVEGMMGLFDGAADGTGSAADLAVLLGLPVVLVVDAARQSHSIAALVRGFQTHRDDLVVAGTILNRVGSERHETMLRDALTSIAMPVLGAVPRDATLELPSRHLGLVQAKEHGALEAFISHAADVIDKHVDLDAVTGLRSSRTLASENPLSIKPLSQRMAVARDEAFAFAYPHLLDGWQKQGAELSFFSPLANESPPQNCDSVFLPGGYPELHAGKLAENGLFFDGLRSMAAKNALIYGECGGYMVLGEGLVDGDGFRHKMANLLPLVTSFEARKLHLGYRLAYPLSDLPFVSQDEALTAHEFHYSSVLGEAGVEPLFSTRDALGKDLGTCGMRAGNVLGSYMHMIDLKERA